MPRSALLLPLSLILACAPTGLDSGADAPATATPPGATDGWMERAQGRIVAQARSIVPEGAGFATALPGHPAIARFTDEGLVLGEVDAAQPLRLRFSAWGHAGAERAVAPTAPVLGDCLVDTLPEGGCARQLEYAHEGVTAWWVGLDQGVEFGWTVAGPPAAGDGALVFVVEVGGADWLEAAGEGAVLVDAAGESWTVSGALAWGADGAPLPAELAVEGDSLVVRVEADGAIFPVTVDPVLTAATTTVTGGSAGDKLGFSVSGAGDVNGDGYDDIVIGAPGYDSGALTDVGAAYLHLGASGGVSSTASRTWMGAAAGDAFGFAVSGGGDVNGDGYDDVIVGAYSYDNGALADAGRVYIYQGSASGVSSTASTTLTGGTAGEAFGRSVAGLGDVNKDGLDDVIIGAPWYQSGALTNAGAAFIHHGSSSGLSSNASRTFSGSGSGSVLGWTVAGAGDVNGDGYDDVILGAPGEDIGALGEAGRAYIYHGSASGVSASASRTMSGTAGSDYLGISVSSAGDVNGDGYDDVIIGALRYGSGSLSESVRAYIYQGSSGGVSGNVSQTLAGGVAVDQLGASVAGAGDVNKDGYDDVILGAPYTTTGGFTYAGAARIHHGSTSGVSATASATLTGGASLDYFGVSVAGAGDVNGDGFDDIIIGAYLDDSGARTDAGAATLHLGYADEDGDGIQVGGDSSTAQDCDDTDAAVGAPSSWYVDSDGDTFGGASTVMACPGTAGTAATATDCDDTRADVNPAATERCDATNTDEDCDGLADDADPTVDPSTHSTFYADADADTFGDAAAPADACDLPAGHVADNTDCDDARADVSPAATELCDAADTDEDCDGLADDGDLSVSPSSFSTFYADMDADAFGDGGAPADACDVPAWHVPDNTDCDDARADVNPGAAELCDAADTDEDCDGLADDADPTVDPTGFGTFYADGDADTYGDADAPASSCDQPAAHVIDNTDCDDARADVHPSAIETCDAADTDEDCDGLADDADPTVDPAGFATFYADVDGDSFGDADAPTPSCDQPAAHVTDNTDCDDARADVNPSVPEVPADGVDQDCDGVDETGGDEGADGDDVVADDDDDEGDDDDKDDIGGGGAVGCATTPASPLTGIAALLALPAFVLRRRRF